MSHLKQLSAQMLLILPAALLLTSGLGCALIEIPSYRLEHEAARDCAQFTTTETSSPTPLPVFPAPEWLVRWKAEKNLPKPPLAPRFHPLPTRPMFSPAESSGGASGVCFGELPAPEAWNGTQNGQIQTQMLPSPQ